MWLMSESKINNCIMQILIFSLNEVFSPVKGFNVSLNKY